MNVIHIVISLAPGGLERLVVDWTNARNRGQPESTRICCLDELGALAEQVEGSPDAVVCVKAKRSRWPFDLAAVRGINQLLSCSVDKLLSVSPKVALSSTTQQPGNSTTDNRHQPVVLHAHNLAAWQYAVLAKLFAFSRLSRLTSHISPFTLPPIPRHSALGAPRSTLYTPRLIYTQHGANIHNISLRDRLRARVLACFTDDIVAVSAATAKSMSAQLWIPLRRIRVIANGVKTPDTPHPNPLPQGARGKEEENTPHPNPLPQGARGKAIVIGSIGRLAHVKGYDRLITAFAALTQPPLPSANASLLLIGDGPEREALQHQAQSLGVAERVIFAGYQPNPAPYHARMDLFVLPSRSEGMSVALLEAMAAGLPVAATDAGANREILNDGQFGTILPADERQWADCLRRLLQNHDATASKAQAARQHVMDHYSLASTLAGYEQLYGADPSPAPILITLTNLFPRPDHPTLGLYNLRLFRELHKQMGTDSNPYLNICLVPTWKLWQWPAIRHWNSPEPASHPSHSSRLPSHSSRLTSHLPTRYLPVFTLPLIGRSINWWFYTRAMAGELPSCPVDKLLSESLKGSVLSSLTTEQPNNLTPNRASKVTEGRNTIIYVPWLYPDGVAVARAIKGTGSRLWLMALGSDTFHLKSRLRRRRIVEACSQAEGIICVAQVLADRLAAAGVPREKLHVVPNGVDPVLFAPTIDHRPSTIDQNAGTILFIGNLVPVKGADVLLRAMALLEEKGEKEMNTLTLSPEGRGNGESSTPSPSDNTLTLTLSPEGRGNGGLSTPSPLGGEGRGEGYNGRSAAGEGNEHPHPRHLENTLTLTLSPEGRGNGESSTPSPSDNTLTLTLSPEGRGKGATNAPHLILIGEGPERQQLEKLAGKLVIADRVHFLGRRPPEEVASWMNRADVLCLPSRSEGMPNVVLEARASGLPVVATPAGALPELPLDKKHFLSVEACTPESLAAGLQEMLGRDLTIRTPDPAIPTWSQMAERILDQVHRKP